MQEKTGAGPRGPRERACEGVRRSEAPRKRVTANGGLTKITKPRSSQRYLRSQKELVRFALRDLQIFVCFVNCACAVRSVCD
jgi:hypothetical protein